MTYSIQTKKSDVAGLVPHPTELLVGELALNYSDMVLYAVDQDGVVQQVSSSGGDRVDMNYTFWAKTVISELSIFTGSDNNGNVLAVNLEGFDVALNGVSLDPYVDYTITADTVTLTEPSVSGDVVIVRNLVPADGISANQSLNTSDIQITGEDRPVRFEDLNLQTQQDVNWYLMDKIDGIEIPEIPELPEDLATTDDITAAIEGLASEDFVLDQDFITEQVVTDAIEGLVNEEYVKAQDEVILAESKKYSDELVSLIDVNEGNAGLNANNDFTGTNTFTSPTHCKTIISDADTVLEIKGDPDTPQHRYIKLRGNADFRIYSYDGDTNEDNARNAFSILRKPGEAYPVTTINYLQDPESNSHAVTLRYANANYAKKEDIKPPQPFVLPQPIVFKSATGCKPTELTSPPSGKVSFLNAPELGGQKNSNKYFGNCNNGIRIYKDNLKNKLGMVFAPNESYDVSGFVSVYGKENHKLYLKAPVVKVSRINDFVDVSFTDSGWASAINYGRGDTAEQVEFVIVIEAFENG